MSNLQIPAFAGMTNRVARSLCVSASLRWLEPLISGQPSFAQKACPVM